MLTDAGLEDGRATCQIVQHASHVLHGWLIKLLSLRRRRERGHIESDGELFEVLVSHAAVQAGGEERVRECVHGQARRDMEEPMRCAAVIGVRQIRGWIKRE